MNCNQDCDQGRRCDCAAPTNRAALREVSQAALRIIQLRKNVGNSAYEKQASEVESTLQAALAEPVQEPITLPPFPPVSQWKRDCPVCGICADVKTYGYVCSRSECPTKVTEQPALNLGDEWQPCVKLPVVVHVRKQRAGETHVSTREGITPVKPDDLIMRGVAGEEYPIGRELFERTYRLGDRLAEQPAPVSVPPGHVVVPLEPTEDQVDAPRYILLYYDTTGRTYEGLRQFLDRACVDYRAWCPEWFKTEIGHMTKAGTAILVYAAMIAARPGGQHD